MGRNKQKTKRNRRKQGDHDDDYDHENESDEKNHHRDEEEEEEPTTATTATKKEAAFKDMDFAQRRELQRKQAAEKRRSKMKCYLCGKAGHVRRECPGIQDDGRGMSRYKGKSNAKHEKEKYLQSKQQNKKNNNHNGATSVEDNAQQPPPPSLDYPKELHRLQDFQYYDISCDVQATIEYCKHGRGKWKISQKEAYQEYQQALHEADTWTNFGGMISKSILKPNRPWIQPIAGAESSSPLPNKTWYVLGLTRDFLYNDMEEEAAIQALVDTLSNNSQLIVGYWAILDYSPEFCKRPGCDGQSQLRRVKATCHAAGQTQTTIQLQVLPGAPPPPPAGSTTAAAAADGSGSSSGSSTGGNSVAGTDYARVLLTLQTILVEMTTQYPNLKIVLTNWAGYSQHMLSFLQAFPNSLYIGLDGAVSFTKATHLHECAFDITLDRLVLATSTIIPAEIANTLGREAFFHSGLWCFVAQAVTHYKRNKVTSIEEVARATSNTVTLQLYPQLLQRQQQEVLAAEIQQQQPAAADG